MSKLRIILPIIIVLGTMVTAGILLYQQLDPRLEQVTFQNTVTPEVATDTTDDWTPVAESPTVATDSADPGTDSTAILAPDNSGDSSQAQSAVVETTTTTATSEVAEDEAQERNEMRTSTNTASTVLVQILKPQGKIICPVASGGTVSAQTIMQQAASQCGFSYSGINYPGLGFFVEQIDEVAQDKAQGVYWIYSINGAKATVGISGQTVVPGDTITWSYEVEY